MAERRRTFVTRTIPAVGLEILSEVCEPVVSPHDRVLTRDELVAGATEADALLCTLADDVDAQVIDAIDVRVIANFAVGINNVDVAHATRCGVPVTNTPGVLVDDTADLTWALILGAARRVVDGDRLTRRGDFRGWTPTFHLGARVTGQTLGIVGFGEIGQAVARRAAAFDMRVLYTSRREHPGVRAQRVSLDALLAQSDVVSIHTALAEETRGLLGAAELARMKPTATLVNTARGEIVDQDALIDALTLGSIAGAGLDVYTDEAHGVDPRFFDLENVVLAPHIGSATRQARDAMATLAARSIVDVLSGCRPAHLVDPTVWR